MIPNSVLFCAGLAGIACAVLPAAAALWLHKKKGATTSAFFWGCGMYLILTITLGSTLSSLLGLLPITDALWFTVLTSSLLAVLNSISRFTAFHWAMKDDRSPENGLAFGAGLGWLDALLMLALELVFIAAIGTAYNRDPAAFAEFTADKNFAATIAQLQNVSAGTLLVNGAERLTAVAMQMALCFLAMTGTTRRRPLLSWAAFGLEAACLCLSTWLSALTQSALLSLAVRVVFTAAAVLLARYSKKIWEETDAPITGASAGKTQTWNAPLRRRPLD